MLKVQRFPHILTNKIILLSLTVLCPEIPFPWSKSKQWFADADPELSCGHHSTHFGHVILDSVQFSAQSFIREETP